MNALRPGRMFMHLSIPVKTDDGYMESQEFFFGFTTSLQWELTSEFPEVYQVTLGLTRCMTDLLHEVMDNKIIGPMRVFHAAPTNPKAMEIPEPGEHHDPQYEVHSVTTFTPVSLMMYGPVAGRLTPAMVLDNMTFNCYERPVTKEASDADLPEKRIWKK